MKKAKIISLLISALLLVSCNETKTDETDSSPDSTTNITDSGADNTESGDDFENFVLTDSKVIVKADGSLVPAFKETPQVKNGTATHKVLKVNVTYESTFYGHDVAIDRDFVQYGRDFKISQGGHDLPARFFLGEFVGNLYNDIISYDGDTLTIYEATPKLAENVIQKLAIKRGMFEKKTEYKLGIKGELRGVGDFDANGYTDFLIANADGEKSVLYVGYASEKGFEVREVGKIKEKVENIFCGDIHGDKYADIIILKDSGSGYYTSRVYSGIGTDKVTATEPAKLPFTDKVDFITVGDINSDKRIDVVFIRGTNELPIVTTLYSRSNGKFGPYEGDETNTNLFSEYSKFNSYKYFAVGDISGDRNDDLFGYIYDEEEDDKMTAMISTGELAYDYSMYGMKMDDGTYRLYAGGRWLDTSDNIAIDKGDGDHIMLYTSDNGTDWLKRIEGPVFYNGWEMGDKTSWWRDNTIEPEVLYVDGKYHMFWQCTGYTSEGNFGDHIGYASSTDGITFERKTDSPVIIPSAGVPNSKFEEELGHGIGFNHEEVIYVPDDPDGKCWWLYVGCFINKSFAGYSRIRSESPTEFRWDEREKCSGTSEIGNQIGYINDYNGKGDKLFFRITFTRIHPKVGTRSIPCFQVSKDGLRWINMGFDFAGPNLDDPVVTEHNYNVYFLGFTTLNGTGEIPKNENGEYELYYFATCSEAPDNMGVYYAEGGLGHLTFKVEDVAEKADSSKDTLSFEASADTVKMFSQYMVTDIKFDSSKKTIRFDGTANTGKSDPGVNFKLGNKTVSADTYKYVVFSYRASRFDTFTQLFFNIGDQGLSEKCSVKFDTTDQGDNKSVVEILDLSSADWWKGELSALRIDYYSGIFADDWYEVDSITFCKTKEAAEAYAKTLK